jgi:ribonuclease E
MSERAQRFRRLERVDPNRFPRRKTKPMSEAPAPTAAERVSALEEELALAKQAAGMAVAEKAVKAEEAYEVEAAEAVDVAATTESVESVDPAVAPAVEPTEQAAVGESDVVAAAEPVQANVEVSEVGEVGAAVEAPVEAAVEAPVGAVVEAPAGAAVEAPVGAEVPVEAAVEAPVDAEVPVEAVVEAKPDPMATEGAMEPEVDGDEKHDEATDEKHAEKHDEKTDEKADVADETTDEKHDNKDEMSPEYRMMTIRLMRVEAAIEQLTMGGGSGVTTLSVANAAVAAADKIATAAAQQSVRVEAVAADLGASLAEKLEVSIQNAVEKGVSDHASLIGSRLHAQFEDRLQVARSTAAGLDALRQEMSAVSKSLAKDIEGDLTPSKLPRHSIFEECK